MLSCRFDSMALRGTVHGVVILNWNMYFSDFMEMVVKCLREEIRLSPLHKTLNMG